MDLLGGVDQMEARSDPFGYSVNLGARFAHGLGGCAIGPEIILCASDGTPR
jgi:hypothetical protein